MCVCLCTRMVFFFLISYSFYTENLALHQPTWEEYPWPDKGRDFGSENAVDGLYDDRGMGGQCTISEDGKYNATWRVDLEGVVSISYINIYYRTDNMRIYFFINILKKIKFLLTLMHYCCFNNSR